MTPANPDDEAMRLADDEDHKKLMKRADDVADGLWGEFSGADARALSSSPQRVGDLLSGAVELAETIKPLNEATDKLMAEVRRLVEEATEFRKQRAVDFGQFATPTLEIEAALLEVRHAAHPPPGGDTAFYLASIQERLRRVRDHLSPPTPAPAVETKPKPGSP